MLTFVVLVFAVAGVVNDYEYVKRGGRRSSLQSKMYFGTFVACCIAAVLASGPYSSIKIGIVGVWLFGIWHLVRWRMRRANPIS